MFGVAPLAALVFNILVIREIRTLTTRGPASVHGPGSGPVAGQNQASTSTLLYVSFYLICTWLPATLVYSLEREFPMQHPNHYTYYTVRKICEEVTISNSACYFFIYYVTGKALQRQCQAVAVSRRFLSVQEQEQQ
ncbi:hypothetical protein C0Q70_19803 [Pomacea canaliculata]|uniref:G-protein coupled receptors family 1 profile domain-containing protein n=1 Tax=Pomacea canaliculata TaxID=400727 RepID=A0A2T7NDR9_POMCA|nr:hypothetical protein C0Q70_19803 [Pomacea canaliculata]